MRLCVDQASSCCAGFDPVESAPEWADRFTIRQNWVNLNAFVARITEAQVHDFALYAIWAFRDALEEPVVAGTDTHVRAAAQWIFHAGQHLYQIERVFPQNVAIAGPLWSGETKGFCKDRWAFWKQRFEELSDDDRLSDEARRDAGDAGRGMADVESRFTL